METSVRSTSASPAETAPRWLPFALAAVLVIWASAFIAIRAVAGVFSADTLALGRMLVGATALSMVVLIRRTRQPAAERRPLPRGRTLGLVAAYGVLWFAAYTVALNAAEQHLDAGTAAMLVNVAPLLVAVIGGLALGEGFPRPLMIGIAVGFGGVALIAAAQWRGGVDAWGIGLGLLSAVLYAAGVLLQKLALANVDALTATWLGAVAGTVVLLPAAPRLVDQALAASPAQLAVVAYLGLMPTAVAFLLWAAVLQRSTAGRTASATLAVPAIAVLLSWLLLGEVPTLLTLVGGALALLGVAIGRGLVARCPVREPVVEERVVEGCAAG